MIKRGESRQQQNLKTMKTTFTLLLSFLSFGFLKAQCSAVTVSVSASDETSIQLYHPGFFNIPSGFANECTWQVSTFLGETVHEEVTSGDAFEQGQILFEHEVPTTDSMKVELLIVNDLEGLMCTIIDTLFWEEIEVLPGSFIGNWAILNESGGVEEEISSINARLMNSSKRFSIYPNLVENQCTVFNNGAPATLIILDGQGREVEHLLLDDEETKLDLSHLVSGMYYLQLMSRSHSILGTERMIKL